MRSDRRYHQPYGNKPRAVARKRRPLPVVAITVRAIAIIAVILVILEVL